VVEKLKNWQWWVCPEMWTRSIITNKTSVPTPQIKFNSSNLPAGLRDWLFFGLNLALIGLFQKRAHVVVQVTALPSPLSTRKNVATNWVETVVWQAIMRRIYMNAVLHAPHPSFVLLHTSLLRGLKWFDYLNRCNLPTYAFLRWGQIAGTTCRAL